MANRIKRLQDKHSTMNETQLEFNTDPNDLVEKARPLPIGNSTMTYSTSGDGEKKIQYPTIPRVVVVRNYTEFYSAMTSALPCVIVPRFEDNIFDLTSVNPQFQVVANKTIFIEDILYIKGLSNSGSSYLRIDFMSTDTTTTIDFIGKLDIHTYQDVTLPNVSPDPAFIKLYSQFPYDLGHKVRFEQLVHGLSTIDETLDWIADNTFFIFAGVIVEYQSSDIDYTALSVPANLNKSNWLSDGIAKSEHVYTLQTMTDRFGNAVSGSDSPIISLSTAGPDKVGGDYSKINFRNFTFTNTMDIDGHIKNYPNDNEPSNNDLRFSTDHNNSLTSLIVDYEGNANVPVNLIVSGTATFSTPDPILNHVYSYTTTKELLNPYNYHEMSIITGPDSTNSLWGIRMRNLKPNFKPDCLSMVTDAVYDANTISIGYYDGVRRSSKDGAVDPSGKNYLIGSSNNISLNGKGGYDPSGFSLLLKHPEIDLTNYNENCILCIMKNGATTNALHMPIYYPKAPRLTRSPEDFKFTLDNGSYKSSEIGLSGDASEMPEYINFDNGLINQEEFYPCVEIYRESN